MKQDASFFENSEPRLIYIAPKLEEALQLERVLAEAGFDFGVEADRYRGGFIFQTERVGAFFYVKLESESAARVFLSAKGYRPAEKEARLEQGDA